MQRVIGLIKETESYHNISKYVIDESSIFLWQAPKPDSSCKDEPAVDDNEDDREICQQSSHGNEPSTYYSKEAMQARVLRPRQFGAVPRGWIVKLVEALGHAIIWFVALLWFVSAYLFDTFTAEGAFVGTLSGGTPGSLKLKFASVRRAHAYGMLVFWSVGALYFTSKKQRIETTCFNRVIGNLTIILWFSFVGPASVFLSLFVDIGESSAHLTSLAVLMYSVVVLDSLVFTSYFFWQAWHVRQGQAGGFPLHDLALGFGFACTLMGLARQILQFAAVACLKLLSFSRDLIPLSWPWSTWALEWAHFMAAIVLEDYRVLALAAIVTGGLLPVILDGARARIIQEGLALSEAATVQLYGSPIPGKAERFLWRMRVLLYLCLAVVVQSQMQDFNTMV